MVGPCPEPVKPRPRDQNSLGAAPSLTLAPFVSSSEVIHCKYFSIEIKMLKHTIKK